MAESLRKSKPTPDGFSTKGWRCLLLGLILIICMELSFIVTTTPGMQPIRILLFCNKNNMTVWRKTPSLFSKYSNVSPTLTPDSRGRNLIVSTGRASLPPFHKKWEVNCIKILQGNEEEIRRSVKLLNVWRLDPKVPPDPFMPPDTEVRTWTNDCDVFKRARNYPRQSLSVEEADFPLAYIIVAHRGSAQVERLLKAIYQPQNIYCIHPDQKAPDDFKSAIKAIADCFENVFVVSRTESVTYAGYTRLLADINCMRDLIGPHWASSYSWKYVINLCSQDFPLKSNLEIVRKLRSYNGHNDISGSEPSGGKRYHTEFRYVDAPGGLRRTEERKEPAPHGIQPRTGIAYYAATRDFVNYVLKNQTAKDFLEWTNGTYSPDETFWASLQQAAGAPGGRYEPPGGSAVRFIRWYGQPSYPRCRGRTIRMVCVFSAGYTQHLAKVQHLFANKFDYAFDPIALQCMEEAVEFRTQHPGALHYKISSQ